jgi:hypothetical protein
MRKTTLAWLATLSAFTLAAGVVLLMTAGPSCNLDDEFLFTPICDPADARPNGLQQAIGGLLLIAGMIGFAVVLFGVSARRGRRPEDSGPCPQCGRAVTAGSPTCLACGYNLLRSRLPR